MVTTSFVGVLAACVASALGGLIIAAFIGGRRMIAADANAKHWRREFDRAICDLATSCEERDRLAYQVKTMEPLYELGQRRQAALDKAKQKAAA